MTEQCENPPVFYSEYFRRAVKNHKCCECHRPISRGERYVACVGLWDGRLETFKQHIHCYHFARYVNLELNKYECIGFGDIRHVVADFGIKHLWDAMHSGIAEVFDGGTGI